MPVLLRVCGLQKAAAAAAWRLLRVLLLRLDEVPVADVVVEDAHTGADQALQLLAEPREVGRIDRGLDFGRPDPVVPTHDPSLLVALSH